MSDVMENTLAEDIARHGGQDNVYLGGSYILCSSDINRNLQGRQSKGVRGRDEGAVLITGIKIMTAQNRGYLLTI
jgi:hypothetical protein